MVGLAINRRAVRLIIILSQLAFISIPGLSQNNEASINNITPDSLTSIIDKQPVNNPSKKHSINFHAGFELGCGRIFRKYHIERNQYYGVGINTDLNNGEVLNLGLTGKVDYKSKFALNSGIIFQYQYFHIKYNQSNVNPNYKLSDNYYYYIIPVIFSTPLIHRDVSVSLEMGLLMEFLISSVYIQTYYDSLGRGIKIKSSETIYEHKSQSLALGLKIVNKNNRINFDLIYLIGLTKFMFFDHDPQFPYLPPPNDFYRKQSILISIQYFFKQH